MSDRERLYEELEVQHCHTILVTVRDHTMIRIGRREEGRLRIYVHPGEGSHGADFYELSPEEAVRLRDQLTEALPRPAPKIDVPMTGTVTWPPKPGMKSPPSKPPERPSWLETGKPLPPGPDVTCYPVGPDGCLKE